MTNNTSNTPETDSPPEVDHRKKVCSKCKQLRFKSEFAWLNGKMQRKARCKDCAGHIYPTFSEPEVNLLSPEDARGELGLILSGELQAAQAVLNDHDGDPYLALTSVIPPRRLSPWNSIAGLPVSTPTKVFKQHLVFHFDDDHLLPRILRDFEVAKEHRAKTKGDKRATSKAAKAKGGRTCQHCGTPIGTAAHARKQFCNGTCRQGFARSSVTENVQGPQCVE